MILDDDLIFSEKPGVEQVSVADWDDDEEDENVLGAVMRFDPTGPIRSSDPNAIRKSPALLLDTARQEAWEAKEEAARALAKEHELKNEAVSAETVVQSMIEASGLTVAEVETRAVEENEIANGKEVGDRNSVVRSPNVGSRDDRGHSLDEGLEGQDFSGMRSMGLGQDTRKPMHMLSRRRILPHRRLNDSATRSTLSWKLSQVLKIHT
jgi:hypothetical protein